MMRAKRVHRELSRKRTTDVERLLITKARGYLSACCLFRSIVRYADQALRSFRGVVVVKKKIKNTFETFLRITTLKGIL